MGFACLCTTIQLYPLSAWHRRAPRDICSPEVGTHGGRIPCSRPPCPGYSPWWLPCPVPSLSLSPGSAPVSSSSSCSQPSPSLSCLPFHFKQLLLPSALFPDASVPHCLPLRVVRAHCCPGACSRTRGHSLPRGASRLGSDFPLTHAVPAPVRPRVPADVRKTGVTALQERASRAHRPLSLTPASQVSSASPQSASHLSPSASQIVSSVSCQARSSRGPGPGAAPSTVSSAPLSCHRLRACLSVPGLGENRAAALAASQNTTLHHLRQKPAFQTRPRCTPSSGRPLIPSPRNLRGAFP